MVFQTKRIPLVACPYPFLPLRNDHHLRLKGSLVVREVAITVKELLVAFEALADDDQQQEAE